VGDRPWDAGLIMTRSADAELRALRRELWLQVVLLGGLIAVLWGVEIVDAFAFGGRLDGMGIRPRTPEGLQGILVAPFLHGGFPHLVANTVPLIVLGWLVLLRDARQFIGVLAVTTLVGGFGVWLLGRPGSIHIGASLWVFGLLGYLLAAGWFERKLGTILLSLFVFALYGGALWGVLPGERGVSWESHLFGFAAGVFAARAFLGGPRRRRARRRRARRLRR